EDGARARLAARRHGRRRAGERRQSGRRRRGALHDRAGMTPVPVSVFPGTQALPIFAAQAIGAFARRGLAVEVTSAPNSDEQRGGLAKGRYLVAQGAADQAVAMIETAKTDAVIVLGGDGGFNRLFVQPDIVSLADLRGRTLAVDVPDTGWSFALYRILALHG